MVDCAFLPNFRHRPCISHIYAYSLPGCSVLLQQHTKPPRAPSPTATFKGAAVSRWATSTSLSTEASPHNRTFTDSQSSTQIDALDYGGPSPITLPVKAADPNASESQAEPSLTKSPSPSTNTSHNTVSSVAFSQQDAADSWSSWSPSVSSLAAGAAAFQQRAALSAKQKNEPAASPYTKISPSAPADSSNGTPRSDAKMEENEKADDAWSNWGFRTQSDGEAAYESRQKLNISTSPTSASRSLGTAASAASFEAPRSMSSGSAITQPQSGASVPPTPQTKSAASTSTTTTSTSLDDPWATWSASPQAEQGGAAAFLSRQRMGTGDRTRNPILPVRPVVTPTQAFKPSVVTASPLKRKKKGKQAPPLPLPSAQRSIPSAMKGHGPAIQVESPASASFVKKAANVTPPRSRPISRHGTRKSTPSSPQLSEQSSMSSSKQNGRQGSIQFPAGSLLAQIANSGSPRQQNNANPKRTPVNVKTDTSLDGVIRYTEKVRQHIADLIARKRIINELNLNAVTQTTENKIQPQIDLLIGNEARDPISSLEQPKLEVVLNELNGLSFNTIASIAATDAADQHFRETSLGLALPVAEGSHRNLRRLSSLDSFHTAKDNIPCLIEDDEGPSDGGSPVTPLQPLRTSNWCSSTPLDDSKPEKVPESIKSPAPLLQSTRLENAVISLGYPADISSRVVDLLKSLPKRDQALCLFNRAVLEAKVADALVVIAAEDQSEEEL